MLGIRVIKTSKSVRRNSIMIYVMLTAMHGSKAAKRRKLTEELDLTWVPQASGHRELPCCCNACLRANGGNHWSTGLKLPIFRTQAVCGSSAFNMAS